MRHRSVAEVLIDLRLAMRRVDLNPVEAKEKIINAERDEAISVLLEDK